ncbi:hypothetical protein ISF_03095 [Cordyceps fumosorosea ARSEF 2679]|uniref:Rhodopsin domain-containing protein n=1 Tax=Cordyceps fumosorosea (strain ARSEF 2679) TaxID=1081104 RepID=A0A168B9W2_CORFA|nr:hypothetical protein ISF_03095 [Cordyceps fumosorosea ARSEF 2679]OAA69825.1 hypothetical protein ISF_03095 [Cordyceps fumosorosea ARSEF 2679]
MADADIRDHMVVGPDDHRAYIVITAVVGLTWSVLVLAIRLFIRLRLTGPFGSDDAAASLATFIAACQTATTLYSVREGVGVRYNDAYRDSMDAGLKAYYASTILYIMALCPAKASMSLLISRVSRQAADKHLLATRIVTAIILAWGLASIFIVAFQCGSARPWDLSAPGHCPNLFPRWLVVEVLSLVIELLISGLAFSLVLDLDMAVRTKLIVIFAFSAQLLVAIPVSYRLVLLRDAATRPDRHASGPPVMFALADPTVVTQVVMHFSVMAATFPCFRQFLQAFNNDFGATTKMGTDDERSGDRSQGVRSSNSYAMSALRSRGEASGGGGGGGELTAPLREVDSDTEVDEVTFRPLAPLRDGLLTPVDDGRSLRSVGSDRAIIQHKQKRA